MRLNENIYKRGMCASDDDPSMLLYTQESALFIFKFFTDQFCYLKKKINRRSNVNSLFDQILC